MNEYQRIWIDGEEVYCKSDAWINADSDSICDEEAMKDILMEEYVSDGTDIDEETWQKNTRAVEGKKLHAKSGTLGELSADGNHEVSAMRCRDGALPGDESMKERRKAPA